jgi:Zn-finger nucleic acid-binding protein
MDCPRCAKRLETETRHGAEIEVCLACRGLYLSPGELDRIADPHQGDLEFSTLDDESFHHDDVHGTTACPACADHVMKKVEFNIYTGIILDYCEGCRGFWLDGKEMGRINEEVRALNEASTEPIRPAMLWFAHFIWSLPR